MCLLELFLIAVGLSMDAFAVSVCKGLSVRTLKAKHAVLCGLYFGGFQLLMPLIGYALGVRFQSLITSIDHWIAFVLLGLIGFNMIREAFGGEEEAEEDSDTDALEQKRKDTLKQIESIKSDISTVEDQIKDLKNSKSDLQTYINKLDKEVNTLASQIKNLQTQIKSSEAQISDKKDEIEASTAELAKAEEEMDEQYSMMKKRIQYMYENGGQSWFELLLESESFPDLVNRIEYASEMTGYDRDMMQQLKEARDVVEEQKNALEQEKQELEDAKKDLQTMLSKVQEQQTAINKAMAAKTQEIADYQSQINTAAGQQDAYEDQLDEQEKLLAQVENQIAAAAAAKAAADDGDGGSSGFMWPCPASHRITSGFGNRTAPVKGASTYHKGIDIGASSGSAIVAASSGRVTTATYSSSAGNYVVISHGGGISTVYMHASALYVSEGDTVSAGDTIAAVGSTGFSTGPHLHFGVIVNGSYVNPSGYVN